MSSFCCCCYSKNTQRMLRGQNIKKRSPTRFPRIKPHITKYLLIMEHVLFHTPHAFSFSEGRILRIQSVTKTHKEYPGEYRLGFCLHINLSLSNSWCRACQVGYNFFWPFALWYFLPTYGKSKPSLLVTWAACLTKSRKCHFLRSWIERLYVQKVVP